MIKVENLTRKYGDFLAVDQVSFSIGQGEIVGLLGHNGAGKTTIMKMLTGFLEPTAGIIRIDDQFIENDLLGIQKKIGYLPENCPLYSDMTVIDYLDYCASLHGIAESERNRSIRDAIGKTELESKATQLISTLSRGYRQRVGVAQAILHNPKILILDEPTNGLDPTQIQHMRSLIKKLSSSATVIVSTHILHEVQAFCDRVIIIRNGRKAMDERLDQLQAESRLLLTTDAAEGTVKPVMTSIGGVLLLEVTQSGPQENHYALTLDSDSDKRETASQVAEATLSRGWKLYQLQPELRDLETIFAEISSVHGEVSV